MNPLALFLPAVAGWVMAWGMFLGVAWAARPVRDAHPISLFDDDLAPSTYSPEPMP